MDVKIIQTVISCPGRNLPKEKCPKCGGIMVEKGNKLLCINEACGYIENKSQKEFLRNFTQEKQKAAVCSFCVKYWKIQKNYDKLKICPRIAGEIVQKTKGRREKSDERTVIRQDSKINKLLHNNNSSKVVFNDICEVLSEILESNVLVISKKEKYLESASHQT